MYGGENFPGLQLLSPFSLYRPGELPVIMALSSTFSEGNSKVIVEGTLPELATDTFTLGIGDEELALDVLVSAGTGSGHLMVLPWRPQAEQVI